jgi:hypothetical protein
MPGARPPRRRILAKESTDSRAIRKILARKRKKTGDLGPGRLRGLFRGVFGEAGIITENGEKLPKKRVCRGGRDRRKRLSRKERRNDDTGKRRKENETKTGKTAEAGRRWELPATGPATRKTGQGRKTENSKNVRNSIENENIGWRFDSDGTLGAADPGTILFGKNSIDASEPVALFSKIFFRPRGEITPVSPREGLKREKVFVKMWYFRLS